MAIIIKTAVEIDKIRAASRIAAEVLKQIEPYIIAGVTTLKLNDLCNRYIIQQGAISACLGYHGFPKSVCISVNEVVCHGIPSARVLKAGDIVNIDVTVIKDGYHGDTSKMFFVGKSSILGERLCRSTQQSLYEAIKIIKPGLRLRRIGQTIQQLVEQQGFSVVRDYCGHGIGANFHEDPQVLHFDADDSGISLQSGMVFTIEPMVNAGKAAIKIMRDNWTAKTKDHSLSAQYEHTILVNDYGCEILTWRQEEQIPKIIVN